MGCRSFGVLKSGEKLGCEAEFVSKGLLRSQIRVYEFQKYKTVLWIFSSVAHNVLPEGGDFEALRYQLSRNFDRSTKLE
jgi:hypothetical protein